MNITKPAHVNQNGVLTVRHTISTTEGTFEIETVIRVHEVARQLGIKACRPKSRTRRSTALSGAIKTAVVRLPGHSDDCPAQKGGECVYPCYMQPTDNRRKA